MNLVDIMRPNDPIPFIANFMLKNKNTLINLDMQRAGCPILIKNFQ